MVNFTAGFAFASLFALANAEGPKTFKVRVRNLTYLQPFSPPLIVAHTKDVAIFNEGKPANDAIKLMAEEGDNSALLELAASEGVAPFICGATVSEGLLLPGETWTGEIEVDTDVCPEPVYSAVSMLINTNDAFMGVDSCDLNCYGSIKDFPPAFDAGTEANTELCDAIPGPGCAADSGNISGGEGEGFVHVARGFHGVGDLAEADYDWRNPVAEIFIAVQD